MLLFAVMTYRISTIETVTYYASHIFQSLNKDISLDIYYCK